MALPPNLRVNTQLPFPSLVIGSGPVTITKLNGVWTIGFSAALLGIQTPPALNYPTDYVLVFDSITGAFFRLPMSAFAGGNRQQRSVKVVGDLPITTADQILNVNGAGLNITVPAAATRSGTPLTFKRVDSSPAFTLTATGPDTFDGQASLVVNTGVITLVPYNDGVNNALGYAIE